MHRKERSLCLVMILLLSLIIPIKASSEEIPVDPSSIVSGWTFDEGEGQNATGYQGAVDMELGNGGETSPSWREGIKGSSLHFDGSDDHCMTDDMDFPSDEFTISLWINTSWTQENRVPLSYATIYESNEFTLEDPSDMTVHIRGLGKSTGISINDGRWHHLAVTWSVSDGHLKVYVDGFEEFTGTVSVGAEIRSGGTLLLGNDQDEVGGGLDPEQAFNGSIDEILLVDRVLDMETIRGIMEYDLPPPKVTSYGPEGEDLPLDSVVTISFNRDMNRGSVENAMSIEPTVNGSFRWDGNSVSFIPDENLSSFTEYSITLEDSAVDTHERLLSGGTEFRFTTEEEDITEDEGEGAGNGNETAVYGDDEEGDQGKESMTDVMLFMGGAVLVFLLLIGLFAFISRKNRE